MRLSIVIPVLNDAPALASLLADLAGALDDPGIEVIVVDGGSVDALDAAVTSQPVRLIKSGRGRGLQLATGVEASRGRIIWLLHADSRVPVDAPEQVLAQASGWGRFRLRFEPDFPGMRMVASMMHWRSRLSGICTGDQGIWIERALLDRVGGIPVQPLMEDVELSIRLRRLAWPRVLPATLTTSSRRWQARGLVTTILLMWWFRLRYFFGTPAQTLAHAYADVRENSATKTRLTDPPESAGSTIPDGRSSKP
jgi:rSAM/selenodomain-associated transferase 2